MQDIHVLIKKYFDGTASDREERELRGMLVSGTYSGEDVEEALAVMGYWAERRRRSKRQRRQKTAWAAAACVAALLSVGTWVMTGIHGRAAGESVAYINGVEYSDEQIDDIMCYQLGLLSEASESVAKSINDDLSGLSIIIE